VELVRVRNLVTTGSSIRKKQEIWTINQRAGKGGGERFDAISCFCWTQTTFRLHHNYVGKEDLLYLIHYLGRGGISRCSQELDPY
jgi:hypothetical protein